MSVGATKSETHIKKITNITETTYGFKKRRQTNLKLKNEKSEREPLPESGCQRETGTERIRDSSESETETQS